MASLQQIQLISVNPSTLGSSLPKSRKSAETWCPRNSFLGVRPAATQGVTAVRRGVLRRAAVTGGAVAEGGAGAAVTTELSVSGLVKLGGSPVEVSPIGIGAWSWGDKFYWNEGSWDDLKLKQAKRAFEASMSTGLTFFDTAEVYGTKQFGGMDSEALLGRFLKETKQPGPAVVATKFAALPWRVGRAAVVKALEDSLKRMGLESCELYQQHWPGLWQNEAYIDGLADCVEKGLAKAIGVSNFNETRTREAHKQLAARGIPLAANQVHYNLLYRVPEENGVKALCDDLGITIIAYSPLAQGMLSGKYTAQNPPTGPRGGLYTAEYLTKIEPVISELKALGEKYGGKTPVQVALNWLVAQGNVVPIPGAKTAEQVEEFAGAIGWSLDTADVARLSELSSKAPKIQGFPAERF